MKINQWTLGLAAVGLVSLPAALLAEEKLNPLLTAVTPTSISGSVSTSVQWAPGTGNAFSSPRVYQQGKADGFNLDVVSLTLDKPLSEDQWASGYHVDMWLGPDANSFNTLNGADASSDLAIKQAYVALRAPLGNGLDVKVGVFDSIIGYESRDSYKDPNYTRSYATSIEPQNHTGVLASYQFSSVVSASAGMANTAVSTVNTRANPPKAESFKTYMASVALTAPDGWGWVSGSTLYAGMVNGWTATDSLNGTTLNLYGGVTLNTPVKGWRFGAAYDYATRTDDAAPGGSQAALNAWAGSVYTSYQLTEKASIHLRGEYAQTDANIYGTGTQLSNGDSKLLGVTATLQYDLWKNVISRLEFIWDHQAGADDMIGYGGDTRKTQTVDDGQGGSTTVPLTHGSRRDNYTIALNIIYRF